MFLFGYGYTLPGDVYILNRQGTASVRQFKTHNYWLFVCRVLCAIVVCTSSNDSFLVSMCWPGKASNSLQENSLSCYTKRICLSTSSSRRLRCVSSSQGQSADRGVVLSIFGGQNARD